MKFLLIGFLLLCIIPACLKTWAGNVRQPRMALGVRLVNNILHIDLPTSSLKSIYEVPVSDHCTAAWRFECWHIPVVSWDQK